MLYNAERPANFDQMIGQTLVVENIRNQSIKDQFFPVFILCGQYGSGKTTMARLIAMASNCEHKDEKGNPCGKCESCTAVLDHSPEGIIEIDGASNNGVDNVRKLLMQASTIGMFKKKVIVIDEAHMLSKSAFNALLITLENPPEHCIFILCTTEKEALPETVVSRAPVYMFGKIPDDLIKEHIQNVAGKNNIKITEDAAGLLSRYANGAMRNALQLLEHLSLQKLENEEITDTDVIRILGLSSLEQRAAFLEGCLSCDIQMIIQILRDCERRGLSLRTFIQDVLEMNTDLLLNKAGAEVVGTHFYMEKIRGLSGVPDMAIIKTNKMLSIIAATPNNQLSVERIVADVIAVMHEPVPTAHEEKTVKAEITAEVKTMEDVPVPETKQETAEESIHMPNGQSETSEEVSMADGFQPIPEGTELPFEEDPKTQQTDQETLAADVQEKPADEPVELNGFDLFGGGLFGGSFVADLVPKKKKPKGESMDLMSQMAVAGSAHMPGLRTVSETPAVELKKETEVIEDDLEKEQAVEVKKAEDDSKDEESETGETEAESIVLSDSVPVHQEGRMTWDEVAAMGIVPERDKLCIPRPESEEELDAIYAQMEEKTREEEEDEIEEKGYASRSDLIRAHEELTRLLKNPGFKILFNKARMVEENFHIYLCFQSQGLVSAVKIFLSGVKGISARLDKE